MTLLIANAEVAGRWVDVRLGPSHIAEIGPDLTSHRDEERYDAAGGALLPGLHDHHLHLHAMAAAARSTRCGPPDVVDHAGLAATLRDADAVLAPGAWLRGVGYHESVAGMLDRNDLDSLVAQRPVRIQHRGGGLWLVNSAGLDALSLLSGRPLPDGVESDATGAPTGRLWRVDDLFHHDADLPDLASIGAQLLSLGITGVTDATPSLVGSALDSLLAARRDGSLPQRLIALGAPNDWTDNLVERGARKLLLHDHDLPLLDDLVDMVADTHRAARPVAVHCVTRTALVLTIAALEITGSVPGDRIEHASVVPAELTAALRSLQVQVVTQPSFVRDRGDAYLACVDADDVDCLYPYATLLDAEIPVAASSDAPFGDVDPWRTIEVAVSRMTASGSILGAHERVSARQALAGYLSRGESPGGSARRIQVGAPSDICLLSVPLDTALDHPDARHVAMVLAGDVRYDASDVSESDPLADLPKPPLR